MSAGSTVRPDAKWRLLTILSRDVLYVSHNKMAALTTAIIDDHMNIFYSVLKKQWIRLLWSFPPTFTNFTNNLRNIKFADTFRVAVPVRNPTPVYQSSASPYSAPLNTNQQFKCPQNKTKCFTQRISEALHWGDTDGIIHDRSNIEKGLSLHWGGTRGVAAKIILRSSLKAVLINQLVNTQAALRRVASSSWIDLWTTATFRFTDHSNRRPKTNEDFKIRNEKFDNSRL